MLAFHNDHKIKAKYTDRVEDHRRLDQIVQGTGWDGSHGCAIGCILETYDHARLPIELGVPEVLGHLADQLHELQSPADARLWPSRFLAAIRPGADLAGVWPLWAIWMLEDPEHGVVRRAAGHPDCEAAIRRVAELYRAGGTPQQFREAAEAARVAWVAAENAAWGAARDAARAAAREAARAAWAAWDAARVARDAARAAAWDAGRAAARAAARNAAWAAARDAARDAWTQAACNKLIALLEAA